MVEADIQREVVEELEPLPLDRQREVLESARRLARVRPRGTPGAELLRFAGTLDSEEARLMMEAIEEGGEQADADAW